MCYVLRVASPLTLSEVRSMLPAGLRADLRDAAEVRLWHAYLPEIETVAALLHGDCSCDLVTPRPQDPKADDAELRRRYRALGAPRATIIEALERHGRARTLRHYASGHWPLALGRFVTEHARNAGETGYLLKYETGGQVVGWSDAPRRGAADLSDHSTTLLSDDAPLRLPVPARSDHTWLAPDRLIIVAP
jgi:hypothetical protein